MTLLSDIYAFINWLAAHGRETYLILFAGSFFETFIFSSFFIYGEIFFLAGSILASMHAANIWLVALVLYLGAIAGDSASYYLGRRIGSSIFKEHRKIFSVANYQKGLRFFEKHGTKAIFLARISGPISWVMPFLAGAYKVPYRSFLPYNVAGVLVGVGQFILIGYFFGLAFLRVLTYVKDLGTIILIVVSVVGTVWLIRREFGPKSSPPENVL